MFKILETLLSPCKIESMSKHWDLFIIFRAGKEYG